LSFMKPFSDVLATMLIHMILSVINKTKYKYIIKKLP
jgi:hypothetical protein